MSAEQNRGTEQENETTQSTERTSRSHQGMGEAEGHKMSRSEAGSLGGKSLSPEEHARAGSQSHKNENR